MSVIELFTKDDCELCDELKIRAQRLAEGFGFEFRVTHLTPGDPLFDKYKHTFPVLKAENGREVSGKVTDNDLWALFLSLTTPPRLY
ncbi:MAG: glutaredoxin family protein, partial [Ignavibacteriales bacterium]|nr:glutaredoxin family protein [Ignavibacteriales bacterium]